MWISDTWKLIPRLFFFFFATQIFRNLPNAIVHTLMLLIVVLSFGTHTIELHRSAVGRVIRFVRLLIINMSIDYFGNIVVVLFLPSMCAKRTRVHWVVIDQKKHLFRKFSVRNSTNEWPDMRMNCSHAPIDPFKYWNVSLVMCFSFDACPIFGKCINT